MHAHLAEGPTKNQAFLVVMGLSAGRCVREDDLITVQNALWHALPHKHEAHGVLYRLWRHNYVREAA